MKSDDKSLIHRLVAAALGIDPIKWRDPKLPVPHVYRLRQHHRISDTQVRVVEKVLYVFPGVECICGNKRLIKRIETMKFPEFVLQTTSFRCSKCNQIPILMTPTRRKFYNEEASQKALEWVGYIAPRGTL